MVTEGNIASLLSDLGQHAEAEVMLRKQIASARALGSRDSELSALTNLAIALYTRGAEDEAIEATQRAADLAAENQDPRIEAASRMLDRAKATGDAWLSQYEQLRLAAADAAKSGRASSIAFEDPVQPPK